jgi:Tryptophan dimethylallyltransferase
MEQDLQKLHELWILVLQQESEAGIEATLPFKDHQTAGILYNFDIKLGSNLPIPKIYMPVKHYSTSDFASAQGLASFLRNAERDDFMGGTCAFSRSSTSTGPWKSREIFRLTSLVDSNVEFPALLHI